MAYKAKIIELFTFMQIGRDFDNIFYLSLFFIIFTIYVVYYFANLEKLMRKLKDGFFELT